jgi:hypothetical protein
MTLSSNSGSKLVHYFVDEAGDPTLFDSKGRTLVGTSGCSRFFILGLLEVEDPSGLGERLNALRSRLLSDPYSQGVPSMRSDAKKTALAFHAKDDLPEIRREVFTLLVDEDVKFFAVVRSKKATLSYVRSRNLSDPAYRYHPNELYDYLVRCLFRDRLHQCDQYRIIFAHRGRRDRTQALKAALDQARRRFAEKWGRESTAAMDMESAGTSDHGGLQAVDYFLWALQRLYEKGEDRFIRMLWHRYRLVRDIDDTRKAEYGAYYNKKTPLLDGHPGI